MATKIKTMKLQDWRESAHTGQAQPTQKPSAFLMQRCHGIQPRPPRRRLIIRIDPKGEMDIPTPVKIVFLKPKETVETHPATA